MRNIETAFLRLTKLADHLKKPSIQAKYHNKLHYVGIPYKLPLIGYNGKFYSLFPFVYTELSILYPLY